MSFEEIRDAKDVGLLVSPDVWNMVCMLMQSNPLYGIKAQLTEVIFEDSVTKHNQFINNIPRTTLWRQLPK